MQLLAQFLQVNPSVKQSGSYRCPELSGQFIGSLLQLPQHCARM